MQGLATTISYPSQPCPAHESAPPKKFGIFYPRGYCVVALRTQEDAERMGWSLIEGGYEEDDV